MICTAANALWLAGCLPEAARYRRATSRVRDEQGNVLLRLVRENGSTEFGRRHGFATIANVREYQARVPIRSYDDYEADITLIAAGEQRLLTRDRVRLLEPTSGSTAATKLIPYTQSLQREFQRGIAAWIGDLFTHDPDLMRGQAYWSVSPATLAAARTPADIPIGFDDDSAYVGGWRRGLVQAVMAAPASLRHAADMETFQYQTLLALVRSSSLRLISIWNPSFLSLILDELPARADRLLSDLRDTPERARALRSALKASTRSERHAVLWPRLRLISCWADGNANAPARALAALFPHARVQPKGLIATEGFVSLPLSGREGSALAVRSHFFEFAPVGSDGHADERSAVLAHELEAGRRYTVIMSTGGGLYRYRLNDVVAVTGHLGQCPLIDFAGKLEYVSDWFGEKLHEAHVAAVLRDAFTSAGSPAFAMIACDRDLAPPAYVAYVESDADDPTLAAAAGAIETGLRRNFHYDYARLLGQLGPLRAFRAAGAAQVYLATAVGAGRRAGDVKPLALDRHDGWSQRFRGGFIPTPSRSTPSGSAPLRLAR
jgi:GH3 auxin-responsive promoter